MAKANVRGEQEGQERGKGRKGSKGREERGRAKGRGREKRVGRITSGYHTLKCHTHLDTHTHTHTYIHTYTHTHTHTRTHAILATPITSYHTCPFRLHMHPATPSPLTHLSCILPPHLYLLPLISCNTCNYLPLVSPSTLLLSPSS